MENIKHQSIERAINILKAFIPNNQPMGTTELSKRLNLNNSTVCRILQALRDNEVLQQDPFTKKYQLGLLAADIGIAVNQSLETHLTSIAQPFLDELSMSIRETAALEVMSGKSTVLVYRVIGPQRLNVSLNIGERLPVHAVSGAKVIMAFSAPETVDKLLNKKLERFTPNTITDPKIVKKHLIGYHSQGVAFDYGELDIDIYSVAAPIFNHEKRPVAAAVIVAPASRMNSGVKSKAIKLVKKAAMSISSKLLFSKKPNFNTKKNITNVKGG